MACVYMPLIINADERDPFAMTINGHSHIKHFIVLKANEIALFANLYMINITLECQGDFRMMAVAVEQRALGGVAPIACGHLRVLAKLGD